MPGLGAEGTTSNGAGAGTVKTAGWGVGGSSRILGTGTGAFASAIGAGPGAERAGCDAGEMLGTGTATIPTGAGVGTVVAKGLSTESGAWRLGWGPAACGLCKGGCTLGAETGTGSGLFPNVTAVVVKPAHRHCLSTYSR